jgi:hypothetical protein
MYSIEQAPFAQGPNRPVAGSPSWAILARFAVMAIHGKACRGTFQVLPLPGAALAKGGVSELCTRNATKSE